MTTSVGQVRGRASTAEPGPAPVDVLRPRQEAPAGYRAGRTRPGWWLPYRDRMGGWRQLRGWCGGHPALSSVLIALAALAVGVAGPRGPNDQPLPDPTAAGWAVLGLACLAVLVRLRYPVQVWGAVLALNVVGTLLDGSLSRALPALFVALYTVAAWRPWRIAVTAALTSAAVLLVASLAVLSGPALSDGSTALVAVGGMTCAIGIAVRNQRAVVAAAIERARIAELTREEEAQRRVAEERLRIARELHDVVAHHISVVNVQAGVARHLLATDPAAADAALRNVRESAAVVLREMGAVLGLLRTSEDPAALAPAPGAERLDELVEEARLAGLVVEASRIGAPRPLAAAADLAAYRLVQEALTNARRHGTGRARLLADWAPDGLLIEVSNAVPAGVPVTAGGGAGSAGFGMLGMRERVAAAGGRLEVEQGEGRFLVRAVLPYGPVGDR